MTNIRPFQIALIGIFALLALGSLFFVMTFENIAGEDPNYIGERVIIWGTLDQQAVMSEVRAIIDDENEDFTAVQYIQKDEATFDQELLNAIAEGRSPDLIMLRSDQIVEHRGKLIPIEYENYSQRQFRDTYIDGAEIYMRPDGIYGIPFAVDPLMMYWNRDLFTSGGLGTPPTSWETLVSVTTPQLTRTNTSLDISQSAIAFGEYANVRNAKEILSMLFLQSGTEVIVESRDRYQVILNQSMGGGTPPGTTALSFYTQFSNPSNVNYSWNRAQQQDRLEFLGGTLAMYFGFASELQPLQQGNPNLNFDVAPVPQGADATVRRGFGTFYAFALPRASNNVSGAYRVALTLANAEHSENIARKVGVAPAHRAPLSRGSADPYEDVIYREALIARAWLDPDPAGSENVFKQMIEDVTSGRARVSEAISDAAGRLRLLF